MSNLNNEKPLTPEQSFILASVLMLGAIVGLVAAILIHSNTKSDPCKVSIESSDCYIEAKGDQYSVVCPSEGKRRDCNFIDQKLTCVIRSI